MAHFSRTKIRKGSPPHYLGAADISEGYVSKPRTPVVSLPYSRRGGRHYLVETNFPGRLPGPEGVYQSRSYFQVTGGTAPTKLVVDGLMAQAYNQFVSKIRERQEASIGITLAEWRESSSMIKRRLSNVVSLAHAVKRRSPQAFFDAFGFRSTRAHHHGFNGLTGRAVKDAANASLEIKFGWAPLIKDLYDAAQVLSKDIPVGIVRSSVSATSSWNIPSNLGFHNYIDEGSASVGIGYRAKIKSVNPNLFLAANLGLINPISIAYEVVPLSFVLNWFLPFGTFLKSFDGLVGVTLGDISRTYRGRASGSDTHTYFSQREVKVSDSFYFGRTLLGSIPVPNFRQQYYASRVVSDFGDGLGKLRTLFELTTQRIK